MWPAATILTQIENISRKFPCAPSSPHFPRGNCFSGLYRCGPGFPYLITTAIWGQFIVRAELWARGRFEDP